MSRKSFSKRVVRKIKKILRPDEAQNLIEKEFIDSKGNTMQMILDMKPHSPKTPTIEWNRKYEKE